MTREELELIGRLYAAERPYHTNRYDAMEQVIRAIRQLREAFKED